MGKGRGAASGSGGLTGCDDDDDACSRSGTTSQVDRSTTGGTREKDNLDGRALSGSGILSWRMSYTDTSTPK